MAAAAGLVTAVSVDDAMQVGTLDVEAERARALAVFEPLKAELKPKHALEFFSNIEKKNPANQQQIEACCTLCDTTVRSTGATKLVDHLIRCPLCPRKDR